MCRGSSVADIYSKSASEGSSICGTLSERCRPAPSSPLMPRPLGIGETLDDGDPQGESLWRRNQKPGAKEHFQKESEGELCITKQQKSLKASRCGSSAAGHSGRFDECLELKHRCHPELMRAGHNDLQSPGPNHQPSLCSQTIPYTPLSLQSTNTVCLS
ncbi:unnamed protein product [Leuciscus chuanchicus]